MAAQRRRGFTRPRETVLRRLKSALKWATLFKRRTMQTTWTYLLAVNLVVHLSGCTRAEVRPGEDGKPVSSSCAEGDAPMPTGACDEELAALVSSGLSEGRQRSIARSVYARAMTRDAHARAAAGGAGTAEETDAALDRLWPRVNTGPIVSVVHALFPPGPNGEVRARSFRASLRDGGTAEAFEQIAKRAGTDVIVERVGHIGNRGRTLDGQSLDPTFVTAALALTPSSPYSDLVRTPYGAHILVLTERLPVQITPIDDQRVATAREVVAERARAFASSSQPLLRGQLAAGGEAFLKSAVFPR